MTDRSCRRAKWPAARLLRARSRAVGQGGWLGVLVASTLAFSVVAGASEIVSYAIVQDDGSLRVQGKTIRLFGVYMPSTGRGCRTDFRPPLCGNRSVRALKAKIRGFVSCAPQAELSDRSLSAVCYVDGDSIVDPPIVFPVTSQWSETQGL